MAYKNKINEKIWWKQHPWMSHYYHIIQRCTNQKCKDFQWYGGKGIKCLLTKEEIKELWFRDKAYEMKKPSIDRADANKNYEFSNCRFMEQLQNTSRSNLQYSKKIIQSNLDGKIIKEWPSISAASKALKLNSGNISTCCHKRSKTCGNYTWSFKIYDSEV